MILPNLEKNPSATGYSEEQINLAKKTANKLPGTTDVVVTSYAVFAVGPDMWVCINCRTAAISTGPLNHQVCGNCGTTLCP